MGLFDRYDVVILGERDHRDTTQYDLIEQIMSDPRFIDQVGLIMTEIGVYNMTGTVDCIRQRQLCVGSGVRDRAMGCLSKSGLHAFVGEYQFPSVPLFRLSDQQASPGGKKAAYLMYRRSVFMASDGRVDARTISGFPAHMGLQRHRYGQQRLDGVV